MDNYREKMWLEKFKFACLYYKEHGDLLVPSDYIIDYDDKKFYLGKWIKTQRTNYKNNILSKERIQMLEKIGMAWDCNFNKWQRMYNLAQEYYKKNGDLLIPEDYIVIINDEKISLGIWLVFQRQYYKKNKLSKEKIEMLKSIGMVWSIKKKYNWDCVYELAKDYYEKNNDLIVPKNYIIEIGEENINLGNWILNQRKNYKNNKLSKEKIEMLEKIEMSWSLSFDKWEEMYKHAKNYYEKHCDLLVPYDYFITVNNKKIDLGKWIFSQRVRYKNNSLSEEKIKRLEKIGMVWKVDFEKRWEEMYEYANDYYEKHGNLLVPRSYEKIIDNKLIKLGKWVQAQRDKYRTGKLSEEKIEKLEKIGMVWNAKFDNWDNMYDVLLKYYEENNDIKIPINGVYIDDKNNEIKLGRWLYNQKKLKKLNPSDKNNKKIELLDSLGMTWDSNIENKQQNKQLIMKKNNKD